MAATLVGLEVPAGRNLEIKSYGSQEYGPIAPARRLCRTI